MKQLLGLVATIGFLAAPTTSLAQSDEWFVGSHPEYHAAMVRETDGILVAVYVAKEPSIYASPVLMETIAPACDPERPIEMHSTEAILAFGATAADRLSEVRSAVQSFFDRSVKPCPVADDLEARFFHRFDAAYLATDALLVEAGIFPLGDGEDLDRDASDPEQVDSSE